jgi:hypothetical protein
MDRRVKAAVADAVQALGLQKAHPPQTITATIGPTATVRFFKFVEHTMTIAVIGIVGGVAAAFIYGPIFAICFVMVVLALHRSEALNGLPNYIQAICYMFVILISGSIFFGLGVAIEKHKEHPMPLNK